MREQSIFPVSELQQQTNNCNMQAKQDIYDEMENMFKRQPQHLDIQTILQFIKQQDCVFSKDEILEIIFSNRFGFGREYGEFFTPNKIAELISVIAEIYNPKSVIDVCCGTGNIISYFSSLPAVKGIDINTEIIQLAQYINPNTDIIAADTLHYDFGDTKYDLVISQPPFGLMAANRRNVEVDIINNSLKLLNINGVAIFIVSDGLLAKRATIEFRQQLLSNFSLDMVISLPIGVFSHTNIKTSVLVVRNGKPSQDIFMSAFEDDSTILADNFKQHKGEFYLPISRVLDRLDRNHYLSLEAIEDMLIGHELIKLSDVSEIITGRFFDRNAFTNRGNYFCFNRKDRDGNNFIDNISNKKCVLRTDDIVVSLIGPNNKIYLYKDDGIKTVITQHYAIIRPAKDNKYISLFLQTEDGIKLLQQQISSHLVEGTISTLTSSSLSNIDIPVLPLSELNELVSKSIELSNKTKLYLLRSSACLNNKDYKSARAYISQAFEYADSEEEKQHMDVYLQNIDRAEELEEKNQQLELEIQQKEAAHKALHEKEKEMLSFFTHTMRNALATAPESLRQVIHLLGSDDYESNQKHYKAINKIAALFSTLSLTDCLIDTFKQSISEPEEFQRAWQNDQQGEATPKWVIASALRQSLNRIIFMSDTSELRQLLNNADTPAIVAMRKSFIDNILPLNLDNQGITAFYQWLSGITSLEIVIEDHDLHFGVNQVKFSLLFAISSELILNALKYWNGSGKIQIRWYTEHEHFIFKVTNACETNASSSLAGTHKGIAFIKRLMELLGEHAQFNCSVEEQLFTAELKLHQSLLENNA